MRCDQILVVEDQPDIRDTIRDVLQLQGFEVAVSANGKEALDFLRDHPRPCLILLDLMMPVMDGWRFLEVLESERRHVLASIPIVIVSAAAELSDVEQHYHCRVLRKPVNIASLVGLAQEYCQPRDS